MGNIAPIGPKETVHIRGGDGPSGSVLVLANGFNCVGRRPFARSTPLPAERNTYVSGYEHMHIPLKASRTVQSRRFIKHELYLK